MTIEEYIQKVKKDFNIEFDTVGEEDHVIAYSSRDIVSFIEEKLRSAYQMGLNDESNLKCEEHRKHPCYVCLDTKYGKWRSAVDKNDPAMKHARLVSTKIAVLGEK